jgi:hypothetical protein
VIKRTQNHGLRHFFTDRAVLINQSGVQTIGSILPVRCNLR